MLEIKECQIRRGVKEVNCKAGRRDIGWRWRKWEWREIVGEMVGKVKNKSGG